MAQAPDNLVSKFKADYPKANAVEWKMESDRYKVTFTDPQNLHHTIVYDKNGRVYTRESELDEASVPSSVREYYANNFPEQVGTRVWLSENEGGTKMYYTPVDDAVLFFDKDGKFTRKEPRTPEVMQPK